MGVPGSPELLDQPLRDGWSAELQSIEGVGHYALQPTWADGHHTVIYTFARLREECPCSPDTARRKAERAAHGEHAGRRRLG